MTSSGVAQAEEKENAENLRQPMNSPRKTEATTEAKKEGGQLAASWEDQCRASLGAAQAFAVLKVTEQN